MILRDPVHGLVSFESDEDQIVEKLLASKEVQRLRRIRQLGLTSFAFPGAEHTRFAHAIGAAHVMQRFVARLRQIDVDLPFWQRLTSERARAAIAAALLHDLGHGPLSHLFEEAMPAAIAHETWTTRILRSPETDVHRILMAEDPRLLESVVGLIHGENELPYLANTVSGLFDVDRCDYLLRDAHATGVGYGAYDLPWLLRSLRLEPVHAPGDPSRDDEPAAPGLAIDGVKGITAIENFVLARLFMFQQVYFHKTTRAAEFIIGSILRRAVALLRDGTSLPLRLRALEAAAVGNEPELSDYLELDDGVLLNAMRAWESAKDPILSDLCKRLRARALFKTIELAGVESDATPEQALAVAQDAAARAGLAPDHYVGVDHASDTPFAGSNSLRVIFPNGRGRSLSEVSFLLGRLRGEALTRVRLIFAPELRDEIAGTLAI